MISSLCWVPRGAARSRPVRFELSEEEYGRITELAAREEQTEREDAVVDGDEGDEVDNEDIDGEEEEGILGIVTGATGDGEEEEFMMMEQGNMAIAMDKDSDDEDADDDEIRPTDTLIAVAITEDESSHLEVQLVTEEGDLYVHHDIHLPDFPLCLAWLDCPPYLTSDGQQQAVGNYVAVGTFDPAIEIWNLDVMDPLEPTAVLGGAVDPSSRRKKKALRPGSHEAAVLGMSWNQTYRPALASASADSTVKIWDVTTQTCSHTFTHHTDKAQAVQWHPKHAWLLASGSFDKTIALLDCRSAVVCAVYQLPSDVEAMVWNPFDEHVLYTAVENGEVVAIDVRNTAYALFSFQAHDATVSSLAFSHRVPGLMATASVDKTVRMWDTASAGASQQPRMVAYKTMNVGKLFALQFSTDDPFMLATAGDQGMLAVWMSSELEVIRNTFSDRVGQEQAIGEAQDFIIGSEDLIAERPEVASLMGGGEADEDNNNEVRISKSSVLKKKKKKNKLLS